MYKKQMTAQKIICLAAIFICAAVFIYSLGIMTDLYDTLYSTIRNPAKPTKTDVPGSIVYYNMQGFNKQFVKVAIGLLLLSVTLFITNTHTRRKYYIGNYVSTAAFSVAAVAATVWSHIQIEIYKLQWLEVDFEALKDHAEMWDTAYTESTFWFDVHYVLGGLLIAVTLALILNAFWKASLMKAETNLINKGKEKSE